MSKPMIELKAVGKTYRTDKIETVALNAIDQAGALEIRAQREKNHVLLEILDDGCGLDADTQAEIFTPFFTSKASGQGLGLTLVKEILLRHRFEFGLSQSSDGRTCFSILIKL